MREREAKVDAAAKDNSTPTRDALQRVAAIRCKEREAGAITELALHQEDLDNKGWRVNLAEDHLFNFMEAWGWQQCVHDLRSMERRVLYERCAPVTDDDLEELNYSSMFAEHVEKLQRAHEAQEQPAGKKRQTAVSGAVQEAEGQLLELFLRWEHESFVRGLRFLQRRATLWCESPMQEQDVPMFIFLDELIQRMEQLCKEMYEYGHLRDQPKRRRQPVQHRVGVN